MFPTLALLFGILAAAGAASGAGSPWIVLAGASVLLSLVPIRLRTRSVSLDIAKGKVTIQGAFLSRRTLVPSDVLGCTTGSLGRDACLVLSLRHRREPTVLTFASEADLDATREALAVGHAGFGRIVAPGKRTSVATVLGAAFSALMFGLFFAITPGSEAWALVMYGAAGLIPLFLREVPKGPEGSLVLAPDGVGYQSPLTYCVVPYTSMESVSLSEDRNTIEITVRQDAPLRLGGSVVPATPVTRLRSINVRGLAPGVRNALAAVITDAADRARGKIRPKATVSFPIATLTIGDETVAKWLARVDAIAAAAMAGGYRSGHVDTDELWRIYEDPDIRPDARAAAGRILSRIVKDSESRIEEGARTFHEEVDVKRVRIALKPEIAESEEPELALLARTAS